MPILSPEERVCLEGKISDMQAQQRRLSREMNEAVTQSSETTHDNAPRDAVLESARVVAATLKRLHDLFAKSRVVALEADQFKVGLGTHFSLENTTSGKTDSYVMTGTANVLEIPNGMPADGPLGGLIFGKEFYEDITFRGVVYTIIPPL